MSTEILRGQGRVNDVGVLVIADNFSIEAKAFFWNEFFKTEAGKKLVPYMGDEAGARLCEVAARWYGEGAEISLVQMGKVVESLLAVRDPALVPPAEPEPVAAVDDRPRRADGTFMSEFEIWSSDPQRSMKEIRDRADRDPAFRAWFQKQYAEQSYQDGGLRVLGTPAREATETDRQVLGGFVCAYNNTPAAKLKLLAGFITVGDKRYTKTQYEDLVQRASLAGLL